MKKIKRLLASLMVVAMLLTTAPLSGFVGLELPNIFEIFANAETYSGKCGDNLTWTFNPDTGELTISGVGEMNLGVNLPLVVPGLAPWYEHKLSIEKVTILDGVTSIGSCAFYNYDSLTCITIPDSVTIIGDSAFRDCDSLTSITLPDGVTSIGSCAFYDCDSLTCITIPDGVTSIGDSAFRDCDSLTSITLLDGVTSIGSYAFYDCVSLTCITIPDSVTIIGDSAFRDCDSLTSITLPDGVTSIGSCAFYDCDSLTCITIPDSVTIIGDSAFRDCDSLTSITLPDGVTSIGSYAFYDCVSLTSITISKSSSIDIGVNVFTNTSYYNDGLNWENDVLYMGNCLIAAKESVSGHYTIKDGTTSVAAYAFEPCSNLTSITIPASVTYFGEDVFYNDWINLTDVYYTGDLKEWCSIKFSNYRSNPIFRTSNFYINGTLVDDKIEIPEGTTIIGDFAFYDFFRLRSVTIPDSVTSIGGGAFYNCSLKSITIPDSVTSIGGSAFAYCSLASITIGNSVTSIGGYAFYKCYALTSVTIPDSVTSIGGYAFYGCNNITSITIGNSIESIGNKAFAREYLGSILPLYIDNVYYNGTLSQWCAIDFDGQFSNPINRAGGFWVNGKSLDNKLDLSQKNIENISSYAFSGFSGINELLIGKNVKSIGEYAFGECLGLTKIVINNTELSERVFSKCSNLANVTIGNRVTSIGGNAFAECSKISDVYYTGDISDWCSISFKDPESNPILYGADLVINGTLLEGDLVIPDGTTTIGKYAFNNYTNLTNIIIPSSVASIGDYAFGNCENLTNITISNGVTSIGEYALYSCDSLTSITIPDSVMSIGDYAFCYCENLTNVTIGNSVTSIGIHVFSVCTSLVSIIVAEKNTAYSSDEYGVLFNKVKTELLLYPQGNTRTSYTIPDSVTSIGGSAFSNCVNLESITIPDNVTSIGGSAFSNCVNLESITIPDNVTNIGKYTFNKCKELAIITIPDSVIRIDNWAFIDCESLTDVYYTGTEKDWNKISIGGYNEDLTNATIHYGSVGPDVPQSAVVKENLDYYIEEDDAHKKLSIQATLKDEWFAKDSAEYNHELGGFCSQFTVLGYTKASHMLTDEQKENGTRPAGYITKNQVLKNALTKMGFSDPEVNLSTNREEVNYFIAHKEITVSGEKKTLIFTGFIGSYHDQWYSNFDPGTEDTHKGFNNAKEFVLEKLRKYIENLDCDVNSTEILITGHSRGAATANLVAAQLIEEATYAFGDEGYAFKENIHTYTFATPNPTTLIDTTYEEYKRIFNIVNPEDFVTKCMPAAWGYARYGTTYVLPSKTNTTSLNYEILKDNMQNYFSYITDGREYKPYALGEGDTFIVYKSLTGVVRNAWMFEHLPLLAGPMNITPRDFFQNTLCHFVSDTASGLDFAYAGYIIAETLSLPLLSSKVYTDVLKYFLWNGTALNPRFKDAHMAETYCAYMMTMPKVELLREKEALLNTVNCPVDIEVIDKETGDVVGRIVNNVIDEEIASKDNAIVMTVDGDSKSFWLPSDGDYDVRLTGNDEGTMDYTVSEIDSDLGETQRVNFFDVSITDGKEMTGEINSEDFVLEEYTLSFEDESAPDMIPTEIMSGDEIVNYNIEVSAEGYGSATNSMTVSSGDYVSLTATPYEGNEFLGWYEDGALISTDMQYSFVAKSDREITAKFKAIIGDVNSDGKINSTDALLCLQHSVGKIKLEGDAFTAADVDKNGFINSSDALKILQFSVGKIDKL